MQVAEIEIKFPVADIPAFRAKVAALGLTLLTERTLETNTLYDTPGRELRLRHQLLRLRTYGSRHIVTHKRSTEAPDIRYKQRIETETGCDDPQAFAEIMMQLGYGPVFRYEKFRTEWEGLRGHLVLDETPIGTWAELEGTPEWIDTTRAELGVAEADCLLDSYGSLFLAWKQRTGSPAENLTFTEVTPEYAVAP